jgi:hypothetical protein
LGHERRTNMLPGPTIIRQCPECGQQIEEWTLASGNTFGERFWTDGKQDAPMLPDQPWLVKCPQCRRLFWLDEAKQIGEVEAFADREDEFSSSRAYETPSETDYLTFLQNADLTLEKEQYVRTRAWWAANDPIREQGPEDTTSIHFSEEQERNLSALYDLLEEEEPGQRLMKAELARERGMFDETLALLKTNFPDDFAKVVSVIRELCEAKSSAVAEIRYEG